MQKGQITIFMLVGLIMLIIFGGLIYIRNSSANTKMEMIGQQLSQQEILSARYYVEETTRQTLLDGIWLMGQQGGKIYKEQGGMSEYEKKDWVEDNDKATAIGIEETKRTEDAYLDGCPLGKKSDGTPCYFYGRTSSDLPTLKPGMEKQLNEYMKNNLPKNLDFRDAKDYSVVKKEIKSINVKINQQDITAEIEYDITVERKGATGQIKTVKAQADLNMDNLYCFNQELMKKDIAELSFDIQQDGSKTEPCIKRKYTVTRKEGAKYDIITVEDETIVHNGKTFQYRWIRQNRAPDASTVGGFSRNVIYDGEPQTYQLFCNQPSDPDEDDTAQLQANPTAGINMYSFFDWLQYKGRGKTGEPLTGPISTCGNFGAASDERNPIKPLDPGQTEIQPNQVCRHEGPWARIKDPGGLQDWFQVKDEQIKCDPTTNPCCNENGCWADGKACNSGTGTCSTGNCVHPPSP